MSSDTSLVQFNLAVVPRHLHTMNFSHHIMSHHSFFSILYPILISLAGKAYISFFPSSFQIQARTIPTLDQWDHNRSIIDPVSRRVSLETWFSCAHVYAHAHEPHDTAQPELSKASHFFFQKNKKKRMSDFRKGSPDIPNQLLITAS